MRRWWRRPVPESEDALDTLDAAQRDFLEGRYAAALEKARAITARAKHVALSWRFLGECFERLDQPAEAATAFAKARELGGPGTEAVFLMEALCLYRAGYETRALARLDAALEVAPGALKREALRVREAIESGAIAHTQRIVH